MLHNKLNVGHQIQKLLFKTNHSKKKKKKIPKISYDLTKKGFNRLNQSDIEKLDSSIKTI